MGQKYRNRSWVWFRLRGKWNYGRVYSFNPGTNKYTITVENGVRCIEAPPGDVRPYDTGKYSKGQVRQFRDPNSSEWLPGVILRPTSPECDAYYVAPKTKYTRTLVIKEKDIR